MKCSAAIFNRDFRLQKQKLEEEQKREAARKRRAELLAAKGAKPMQHMKPQDFNFLHVLGRGSFGKVRSCDLTLTTQRRIAVGVIYSRLGFLDFFTLSSAPALKVLSTIDLPSC